MDHAKLAVKSAAAAVRFRELQLKRMKDLFEKKSIDENLLNESQERHVAAVDAEKSAELAVMAAKAHYVVAKAKLVQGKVGVAAAECDVAAAAMKLDNSKDRLSYKTITTPFDGVVTERNFSTGAFIRSGNDAPMQKPLFVVQRTDLMRVVIAIPEADVPTIKRGDAAEVVFHALPGKKWSAKIWRLSGAIDPKTASMRAELLLANPDGIIHPGMSGAVAIRLEDRK